nr:hypothetical protein [Tanacetum cinerariifolium]
AAEGFEQIIDFLSGSYIYYALTVNPHIYVSCIKQFWNTASVKHDAEGVVCFPNEEIFAGLAQMGYKKPSTKLTFYKAFFSSQWKFLIHTLLQLLSAKRTSWNEFSSAMASAVICLSTGQKFNFSKYIFDSLVRNVDSSSKFYMYPRFIQLFIQNQIGDLSTHTIRYISPDLTQKVFENMRWAGKGFSGVETPLFEGMLAAREIAEEGIAEEQVQADDAVAAAVQETVAEDNLEHDKAAQKLEIIKLKARVKSATISTAKPSIPVAAPTVVAAYTRRRKGVIIRDPEEELSSKTHAETPKLKDKGKARFDANMRFLFKSREEM